MTARLRAKTNEDAVVKFSSMKAGSKIDVIGWEDWEKEPNKYVVGNFKSTLKPEYVVILTDTKIPETENAGKTTDVLIKMPGIVSKDGLKKSDFFEKLQQHIDRYLAQNARAGGHSASAAQSQVASVRRKRNVKLSDQSMALSDQEEAESRERKQQYVEALRSERGGAFTSEELREKLGVSREALRQRREKFSIVYWTDPKGHCHYPKWQFTPEMKVHPYVLKMVRFMNSHDTTLVLRRFLVPCIGEPERSALDLIEAGEGEEALRIVRSWYK